MERKNIWLKYDETELKKVESVNKEYIQFLNSGKTERECVKISVDMAEKNGYKNLADIIKNKTKLKAGD